MSDLDYFKDSMDKIRDELTHRLPYKMIGKVNKKKVMRVLKEVFEDD